MPKGLIRPSGGRPDKRVTCRVSISDIRRHAEMAPGVDINCGELLRMQLQLREAFSFYFAQQREVMKAPVMRRNLEQIATAARQLLAVPNKQKWRERLEDHLQTSRYDRPGLPVRTRLISPAAGPELSELESALDYGPLLALNASARLI